MPCTASAKSLRRARPVRRAVRDSARWARFNSIPDVSHRALIAGASSAVLAIGLVGCGSSSSSSVDTTNGPFALPPEAGHVHGIAPRPAGGIVVGTHGGLYAAGSDGALARVGDSADYMGLAALPPAALLSSGHPGPESDEPNPLGLRRSDDGGATWTRIDSVPRDDYHVIGPAAAACTRWAATGQPTPARRPPRSRRSARLRKASLTLRHIRRAARAWSRPRSRGCDAQMMAAAPGLRPVIASGWCRGPAPRRCSWWMPLAASR